jgi:hypothetical protein
MPILIGAFSLSPFLSLEIHENKNKKKVEKELFIYYIKPVTYSGFENQGEKVLWRRNGIT